LELGDDLIEPVANGGIANLEQRGHFLQAAAGFDEVADEGLILSRKGGERWKRVNPLHLGATLITAEPPHLESMLAARAEDGKALHLNKIDSKLNYIQERIHKSHSTVLMGIASPARAMRREWGGPGKQGEMKSS
jgi:hypothetical protein